MTASHDNADEPTVKQQSHPWAVLEGDTPLFHVPGTYPPEYAPDAVLEPLWRAKRKTTMRPYYEASGITIYHGDCRDVLPSLREKPALVLADPPYGMNYKHGKGATKNGKHYNRGYLPPVVGDDEPFDPKPILDVGAPTILWGANHYADKLPASPAWYIWDKRDGISSNDNSDCELAWVNFGGSTRVYRHVWNGVIRASENGDKHLHSTQKPVALMRWCLLRAKLAPGALVFDPYMGSGPIAQACKELGYRYIGCELVEQYCEAAARRLQQEVMQFESEAA